MSAQFQQNKATLTAGGHINSNNTISNIHNYLPAQSAAPLPPLLRCPLPSARFTGREAELDKMARFFFRKELESQNFALIGMGGCGKSQLAFYFFHKHVLKSDKYDPSMVFFVDATTTATLDESFKAIARSKGIGDSADLALSWLANTGSPSFLLYDNADDPTIDLRSWLPQSTKASVLITTRLHHSGHIYGDGKDAFIHLQALPEADAESLLMKTAGVGEGQRASVRALVKDLHCYALAVAQAGAGIRLLQLSVEEYIHLFRQHRTELMNGQKDGVSSKDLDKYLWTVRTAYRISLPHLHDKPHSRALLRIFGHLHHSGITEEIFCRAFKRIKGYEPAVPLSKEEESALSLLRDLLTACSRNGSWDSLAFKRAMAELLSLSLVIYDVERNEYQIHPYTCDALQHDYPDFHPAAFLLSQAYMSNRDDEVFAYRLSPHAERILAASSGTNLHPDLASVLGKICVHLNQGRRSEDLLRLSVERCQREAGDSASSTLRCLAWFAGTLCYLGRYDKARSLEEQVLQKRTLLLGSDHPGTVRAMANLAATLDFLGRYDEAKSLQEQVLEKRTLLLGSDHPETVQAMGNLAATQHFLGRYHEAKLLQEEVLEKRTLLHGSDHSFTVATMANLAATLRCLGRYDEAKAMEEQVLQKRTLLLGSDHPGTVRAMANLAATLDFLERYDEAKSLEAQVLEKRILILGSDHLDTILAMANLAITLRSLGRFGEARSLEEQVLEKRTLLLGPDHPETVRAKAHLAGTLRSLSRHDEARSLEAQVLEKRTLLLGPDHPETVRAKAHLAVTLRSLDRHDEARSLEAQVLEKRTLLLGPDHPETVRAKAHLAVTLRSLSRHDEARSLEAQVLEKRILILGSDHPDTILAMANLAITLRFLGCSDEARPLFEQVLEKRTLLLGPDHAKTLRAMGNLADTLRHLSCYDEAKSFEEQVLEKRTLLLGSDHPATVRARDNLAHTLRSLGRYNDTQSLEEQVLEKRRLPLGSDHPLTSVQLIWVHNTVFQPPPLGVSETLTGSIVGDLSNISKDASCITDRKCVKGPPLEFFLQWLRGTFSTPFTNTTTPIVINTRKVSTVFEALDQASATTTRMKQVFIAVIARPSTCVLYEVPYVNHTPFLSLT